MSLLAPLYLLGGLAIALPILVHLIRRRPKAQAEFSSLMFLRESPPQLTKRSRLDDWPLLLLRALAIALLAIAFARPYWRSKETRAADVSGRRFVLLIDTSASMQRPGINTAVKDRVDEFADQLEAGDSVACVLFDATPRIALDFDQAAKVELAARRDLVRDIAESIEPTFWGTDLGAAVTFAADHGSHQVADSPINADVPSESKSSTANSSDTNHTVHLVVVTDLQQGSQTGALQSFVWPDNVTAELQTVAADGTTNASLRLLRDSDTASTDDDRKETLKVRIQNTPSASTTQFELFWSDANGNGKRVAAANVQVGPGQTRVVEIEPPLPGDEAILIEGDDHSFDNAIYVVTPEQKEQRLIYIGQDADKVAKDPAHYIKLVPLDDARRRVEFARLEPSADAIQLPGPDHVDRDVLTVVAAPLSSDQTGRLESYLDAGGHVLAVLSAEQSTEGWTQFIDRLANTSVTIREADVDEYALWSQIDYRDPLFRLMADPQYSDFSNLRFWSHRSITSNNGDIEDSFDVVVRYDDGDPAILRRSVGQGRLTLLMSGWQPSESQLALSTKFIPLAFQFFDPVALTAGAQPKSIELKSGAAMEWMAKQSDQKSPQTLSLSGTWGTEDLPGPEEVDRPGILQFSTSTGSPAKTTTVAVNLLSDESRTDPMDPAALEAQGLVLGKPANSAEQITKQKQIRDVELEDKQGWWRFILAATLGMLAVETAWSGRRRRSPIASEGK